MAFAQVMKTLALDDTVISSPLDLVTLSRNGLPQHVIKKIAKYLHVNTSELARLLAVSPKTVERYSKDKNKLLSSAVSQRILKLIMVKIECEAVFGENNKACNEWLESEVVALGGKTPLDLMDNDFGIDMVLTELGRIKYGVVS